LAMVDLNLLAEQVIDMTRPRWRDISQQLGVTITMKTEFSNPAPKLLANETEIREALTNLLLNSVDALPHGGVIIVRTRVAVSKYPGTSSDRPTHAILEVSDTGVGMDEKTRTHCLDPFFSTKGRRGTGLGLAMVYGVMERHEGNIEIESQV